MDTEKATPNPGILEENRRLRKMNEMYQLILDCVDCGIYAVDEESNILVYNKGMEEAEGYHRREILGKNEQDYFIFDRYSAHGTINDEIHFSHQPQIDAVIRYTTSKGKRLSFLVNGFPFFFENQYAGAVNIGYTIDQFQQLMKQVQKWQNIFLSKGDKENPANHYTLDDIITADPAMLRIIRDAKIAAAKEISVMIIGETGTGKEMIAQGIHQAGINRNGPFISVNCAAIPETLLESVLFGTVKGAFTGANNMPGLFEQANGGTIFLDELNSMSPALQSKLLRVVQEMRLRRVGSTKETPLHCRIISATNSDPRRSPHEFRADLLFRLQVVSFELPPLRERSKDIPLLTKHFIKKINLRQSTRVETIDSKLERIFAAYHWPGNIRELENIIESALCFTDSTETVLRFDALPDYCKELLAAEKPASTTFKADENTTLRRAMREFEKNFLIKALNRHQWNITHTAKDIGMQRQNLHAKIKEYDLKKLQPKEKKSETEV